MTCGKARHREGGESADLRQGRASQATGEPPTNPIDLYRHGIALRDRGQLTEALKSLLAARGRPGAPLEATLEAARLAFRLGRIEDAFRWANEAAGRHPRSHLIPLLVGTMLRRLGRRTEAIGQFTRAQALNRADVESLKGLTMSLVELARTTEAEPFALRLRELTPDDSIVHSMLSYIYIETNRPQSAIDAAQKALRLSSDDTSAMLQLARGLSQTGRSDEAVAVLMRAKRLSPDLPGIDVRVARALREAGHIEAAREGLIEALKHDANNLNAFWELSRIHDFRVGDPLIGTMEANVQRLTQRGDARKLHFALGKAYDDVGEFQRAFHHFQRGNDIDRAAYRYNEQSALARLHEVGEVFSAEFLERMRGNGAPSGQPIFIVGMPRSGTTLVEQILASHPDVTAGGEVVFLEQALRNTVATDPRTGHYDIRALTGDSLGRIASDYLQSVDRIACGKPLVTDKLLSNARWLGLIHLALPNAKVIHCLRDPIDTCLSCFMSPFGETIGYASDLAWLGRYYRQHHAMMAHWQRALPPKSVLAVRYEDVTSDAEAQARRILAFCGLAWDERCLRFHETQRPINTMSAAQVRKPLYRSSVGRWRAYANHLGPLIAALGDLAPQPICPRSHEG